MDDAIDSNADLAEAILGVGLQSFGVNLDENSWKGQATPNDLDKARSTIRQFYRDWSDDGLPERHASYSPILLALKDHLPSTEPSQYHQYHVLVPGAGLGRLVLDICAAGYSVEGNEISYHQLLASNYILNYTQSAGQHTLYPWALSFSNHMKRAYQLRSVSIPDVHPAAHLEESSEAHLSKVHYSERMSMTAGDFCVLYRQAEYRNSFDAVSTCFFIDTAPNLIRYIDTIRHCLKAGGVWINVGPLLWHFESCPTAAEKEKQRQKSPSRQRFNTHVGGANPVNDDQVKPKSNNEGIGEPGSFELSNDEVVALVERLGFEVVEHKLSPAGATGYIQDPHSMLQNVYQPAFWVTKKK